MGKNLFFKKSGTGNKTLLLFHGFGQTHTTFSTLAGRTGATYTVYAFDLYYHGKSTRADGALSLADWKQDLEDFFYREKVDQFSIVAFSLGGRFALATAFLFPSRLQKLVLIAPDGIYKNIWFRFSTSWIGNPFFRHMMLNPGKFNMLLNIFEKYRLTSPSMIRFARRELANPDNCLRVYRSWTFFKALQLAPSTVARSVNQHNVEVHIILGKKDNIIPVKEILPKLTSIKNLHQHIFPLKHHELVNESYRLLSEIFGR